MMKTRFSTITSFVIILTLCISPIAFAGSWQYAGDLGNARDMHAAVYNATDTTIYILGGQIVTASPEDFVGEGNDSIGVQYIKMDTSGDYPVVTSWGWGPSLTAYQLTCSVTENVASYNFDGAFIYNDRLYITPCNTNATAPWGVNDILMTDIASGGILSGTWVVAATAPVATSGNVLFDAGWALHEPSQRVYVACGREALEACGGGGATRMTNVVSGQFQPDGTITNWRSETAFPGTANDWGMLEIVGDLAVYIAGYNGSVGLNAVYVAPIGTDGVIGTWTASANNLPVTAYMQSGCTDGDYVYVLTGRITASTYFTQSYRAKINTGGTDIEAWEVIADTPYQNRYAAACGGDGEYFITGGRDYTNLAGAIVADIYSWSPLADVKDWSLY